MTSIIDLLKQAVSGSKETGLATRESTLDIQPYDPVEDILERGPQSREEFGIFIDELLGPVFNLHDFAGAAYSEDVNPMDQCWETICFAHGRDKHWNQLTPKQISKSIKRIVVKACRGGGKTFWMAVAAFVICAYIPEYEISWTAAEDQQIDAAWKYFKKFYSHHRTRFKHKFKKIRNPVVISTVRFENESMIHRVTCSVNGLNSKHPNAFFLDEVETMDWHVIVEGLLSAMTPDANTRPVFYLMGSTQKQYGATMHKLLDEVEEGKSRLNKWNCMTVVETCPDWRREDLPAGVTCSDWKPLAERAAELESKSLGRSEGERMELRQINHKLDVLKNNCALCEYCQGKAIKANGYISIDKLVEDLVNDRKGFEVQMMCLRPSMENAVWPELDPEENFPDYLYFNPGAEQYGTVDFGNLLDPTAIGLFNLVGSGLEGWYEKEIENCDEDSLLPILEELQEVYGITMWAVDATATKLRNLMVEAGLPVYARKADRKLGAADVAYFIKDGRGVRRLKISRKLCPRTFLQMMTYPKDATGLPTKKRMKDHHWDHCDKMRYLCTMVLAGPGGLAETLRESYAETRTG